jgi:Leucine-rich repeat (LRR) protein
LKQLLESSLDSCLLKAGLNSSQLPKKKTYAISQNKQADLKLTNLKLKFVSVNMFSAGLQTIELSHNQLLVLPHEICGLHSLRVLTVNNNLLSQLPDQLWRLSKLTEIVASHNKIKHVPTQMEWLADLRILKLDNNKIKRLPPKLSQLQRLTLLYLHENKIAELPREVTHLGNLQELSLEWFTYTTQTNSKFLKSADAVKMFYSYVRAINSEKVTFTQFLIAYHSP